MTKELLARLERFLGNRVTLHSKPLPDPEPVLHPNRNSGL
jgi:hypothetical protein